MEETQVFEITSIIKEEPEELANIEIGQRRYSKRRKTEIIIDEAIITEDEIKVKEEDTEEARTNDGSFFFGDEIPLAGT